MAGAPCFAPWHCTSQSGGAALRLPPAIGPPAPANRPTTDAHQPSTSHTAHTQTTTPPRPSSAACAWWSTPSTSRCPRAARRRRWRRWRRPPPPSRPSRRPTARPRRRQGLALQRLLLARRLPPPCRRMERRRRRRAARRTRRWRRRGRRQPPRCTACWLGAWCPSCSASWCRRTPCARPWRWRVRLPGCPLPAACGAQSWLGWSGLAGGCLGVMLPGGPRHALAFGRTWVLTPRLAPPRSLPPAPCPACSRQGAAAAARGGDAHAAAAHAAKGGKPAARAHAEHAVRGDSSGPAQPPFARLSGRRACPDGSQPCMHSSRPALRSPCARPHMHPPTCSDSARAVLVSMVKQLGPAYLPFVCEVLQSGGCTRATRVRAAGPGRGAAAPRGQG